MRAIEPSVQDQSFKIIQGTAKPADNLFRLMALQARAYPARS